MHAAAHRPPAPLPSSLLCPLAHLVRVRVFILQSFGGVTSGPPEKKMGIKCSP